MTITDPAVRAEALRAALGPLVVLPGDAAYETLRLPWNRAIDQRPAAIAVPTTTADVSAIVRAAASAGLTVAPQATGHAAGALSDATGALAESVLVDLSGLRGATIDAAAATATVAAGTPWSEVLAGAAPHGLTASHGSAADVGVVGYTLPGGLSFVARAHGLAVNAVRSAEVVLADGSVVRADADENPELFWALRGGAGAFGIVTALEIDLLRYADVFAGMLLWDAVRAPEVARAWSAWTAAAPESATTTFRIMHFPPLPELPPFLSGRSVAVVDGAILDTDAAAAALLAPLRALGPEIDTFARIPAADLVGVHMDPPAPTPAFTWSMVLDSFPVAAADAFTAAAATPGLFIAEARHIGGAAARRPAHAGAVGAIDGEFVVQAVSIPMPGGPDAPAAVRAAIGLLEPWRAHGDVALALTFVEGGVADCGPGYGAAAPRLREIKERLDPTEVFATVRPF
jgi:FAD/FMN-containing dehydrogenase